MCLVCSSAPALCFPDLGILFATMTDSTHLLDGLALVPSSKGSCLMVASSPESCTPSGVSRGGNQGGGNERPVPLSWEESSVWLLLQLALFGFYLDCEPMALSRDGKIRAQNKRFCSRSLVLSDYSVRWAKHKTFWKERDFQYGALKPPLPPQWKANRVVLLSVLDGYLFPDALS